MRAVAHAKVNLTLRVERLRPDGFHDLVSVFQSIGWSDRLELSTVEPSVGDPGIISEDGRPVVDGEDNVAWRAVQAVRHRVGAEAALALRLDKRIPVAAGLGGGSADAAAALHLATRLLGASPDVPAELAPDLGSDVPFCVTGGTALVTGRGEVVTPLPAVLGYALAVVVPPVELSTPAVFHAWDDLGGVAGPALPASAAPPLLREHGPLRNDLYAAAVALAPEVDEWRVELETRWGRPVALSGSGPALFAFFVDLDEAQGAVGDVPRGARGAEAVEPVSVGWEPLADDPER
jgi:4-diphosphocytidyl-2C-methyl-D-erythritol kinase